MKQMLDTVQSAWQNDEFTRSVSSFQSFCGVLGMERLPEFLDANNFRGIQDWSEQPLGTDGQVLQAAILDRSQVNWSQAHDCTVLLTQNSNFPFVLQKPSLRPLSRN
jgi:hypothetical protein